MMGEKEGGRRKGGGDVHPTILPFPVCSSCAVCLSSHVSQATEKKKSRAAGAQTHAVTWMLGFCPLISALERSGKLCRSKMKVPGPSLCTLPPFAQGKAKRCSGPDLLSSGASWTEELLFTFMLF